MSDAAVEEIRPIRMNRAVVNYDNGNERVRCYNPDNWHWYRDAAGMWHDVAPEHVVEVENDHGDAFMGRLEHPVTTGFWHDRNKFLGWRRGKQQLEISLSSIRYNNDVVAPDISQEKQLTPNAVDLGDIVVESTRHYTRSLVKSREDSEFIEARYIVHPNGMTVKKVNGEYWFFENGKFMYRFREPKLIGLDFKPLLHTHGPCQLCGRCCNEINCEYLTDIHTCSKYATRPDDCREYVCSKMTDVPLLEHEMMRLDDGTFLYVKRTTDAFREAYNLPDKFYLDTSTYYGNSADGCIYSTLDVWAVVHGAGAGTVDDTSAALQFAAACDKIKADYQIYRSHIFIDSLGLPGTPVSGSLYLKANVYANSTVSLQQSIASNPLVATDYVAFTGGLGTDTPTALSTTVFTALVLNATGLGMVSDPLSKFCIREYSADYVNVAAEMWNGLEFTEGTNDPYLELEFASMMNRVLGFM